MAYTFDQLFAADPANPANVAANTAITIFAPGDPTMAPIAITDPDGQPLANPITVNANGFGSAFMADLDRVAWAGGGFTGFFTSYDGIKQVALDAQAAAELAASTAGAAAVANVESRIAAGEFKGADGTNGVNGSNVLPTQQAIEQALINDGPAKAALAARDTLNILDYGVTRGTASSQTVAIKAALDANPGRTFYFPPGDYRLDTGLVINQGNSLRLDEDARLYAGAAMTTLVTYLWTGTGYAEDKAITGGLLDGNLNANRILSLGKVIRFTLTRTNFKNGINRGLVLEAGLGAELFGYDLRFYNTGTSNVTDNIAIEANMGDCHFRDVIVRNWTTAFKDTAANRWDRCHPWIDQDTGTVTQMTSRYPTSVAYDLTGFSDLQGCMSDTYRTAYKFRSNGTSFTEPPRLLNCRAMWAQDPILQTSLATAYPATVFDNTDGVGAISDRFSMSGHIDAPATFLTGPATNLTARDTKNGGFVLGAQGTTGDSFNYLDGIQQGSFLFTPTLYGSGGAGVHAYTAQIGRMVVGAETTTYFVRVQATTDSTTAFAGALRIGGLPLPHGATNVDNGAGYVGYAVNANVHSVMIFGSTAPYISVMTNQGTAGIQETDIPAQGLRNKAVHIIAQVTVRHYKA